MLNVQQIREDYTISKQTLPTCLAAPLKHKKGAVQWPVIIEQISMWPEDWNHEYHMEIPRKDSWAVNYSAQDIAFLITVKGEKSWERFDYDASLQCQDALETRYQHIPDVVC